MKSSRVRKTLFLVISVWFIFSMTVYGQSDSMSNKTALNKQEQGNANKIPFIKNGFESWNIFLIIGVQIFAIGATLIGLRLERKNIERQIESTEKNLLKKNYIDSTMKLVDAISIIVNESSKAKESSIGITDAKPCSGTHIINEMKCIMLLDKNVCVENDFYECITRYRNSGVSIIDDWIKEIEEKSNKVINNRLNK